MFFSHHTSKGYSGPEQNAAGTDAGWPLPTAADVQAFLLQALAESGTEWLRPVMPLCENIPPLSGNILEVHFDKGENNVDFTTRLNETFDNALITGFRCHDYTLPSMPAGFASIVNGAGTAFRHGIENIWVEYDAPFTGPPALFFDIHKARPYHPQEAFDSLQQITTAFAYQLHVPIPEFLERLNRRGLKVGYYGLMFSRILPSLRLTIKGIEAEGLSDALKGLGWKGNYKALEKLTSMYLSKEQKLMVGIDVGNGVQARIGIEVYDGKAADFIQRLYGNGHINGAQFEALRTWEQKLALPAYLEAALTELHRRPVTELHTRLNHFKFVVDDTETIKAKGYLYYCF